MICLVMLQNCLDFVEGGTGSCSEACVTCDVDGTEEFSIKVEETIDIKDEIPEATEFSPIQTEHEVRLQGVCEVVAAHVFRPFIASEANVKLHLTVCCFMLYCELHIPFEVCIVILKRRDILEVLAITGIIILKYTLMKQFSNMWTAFLWLCRPVVVCSTGKIKHNILYDCG